MTGLRLAASVALILAITAEMVIGNPGLGTLIMLSRSTPGDSAGLYAFVVVAGLLGVAINTVFRLIERRALSLAPVRTRGGGPVTRHPGRTAATPRTPRPVGSQHRGGHVLFALGLPALILVAWDALPTSPDEAIGAAKFYPDPVTVGRAFVDNWIGPAFVEEVLPSLVPPRHRHRRVHRGRHRRRHRHRPAAVAARARPSRCWSSSAPSRRRR